MKKSIIQREYLPGILLLLAFAAYFSSEALLRQATVSRINPKAVNLEKLVERFPDGMRDKIQYRMLMTQLQNNVRTAVTPEERISAMTALAVFTRDETEKVNLFRAILKKFRMEPGTYTAYVFFMFPDSGRAEVTVDQFFAYQKTLPPVERYYAWIAAFNKMLAQKKTPSSESVISFLKPVLEFDPPFSEYYVLYNELAQRARRTGDRALAEKAGNLADQCTYLRSFMDYMTQLEQDRMLRSAREESVPSPKQEKKPGGAMK